MNRVALACLLAALVLPAAGCGSGSSQGAAGAGVAPASTQVFVSVDTSFDSSNWDAGRELLAKFPDGDRAVAWVLDQLGARGIDVARDVEPALGPETDIVVLDAGGLTRFVGLTQPDDRAKLEALLGKGDHPLVSREVDGWVAFSESEAGLDAFEEQRKDGTLDGVGAYEDVAGEVDSDALVHVYVAGAAVKETPLGAVFGSDLPSLALSLNPEEGGVKIEGAAKPASSDLFPEEFKAELPQKIPAGVYAYAGMNDLERQLSLLRDALAEAAPNLDRDLARAEAELGVSLDEDVLPLFSRESALYVRPGFPIPEITILTQVDDEQAAVATLDKLADELSEYLGGAEATREQIDGIDLRRIRVNPLVSIYYGAFDGQLVISTSQQGIGDLRGDEDRLADDEDFKTALDKAGAPDETTGLLYVDLAKTVPAVLGLAQFGGDLPDWLGPNLEPLESLVLYGQRDGDTFTFTGLLSVQ